MRILLINMLDDILDRLTYQEILSAFTLILFSVNLFCISVYYNRVRNMFRRNQCLLDLRSVLLNKTTCNINNLLSITIRLGDTQFQTISECLFEMGKQCDV